MNWLIEMTNGETYTAPINDAWHIQAWIDGLEDTFPGCFLSACGEARPFREPMLQCTRCRKVTTTLEAESRVFNPGRCGNCGGRLEPSPVP